MLSDDHSGSISVVPDGCVDIVWSDGFLHVAGPDLVAATPILKPGTAIIGVRFQPGAARSWLGLPMSEIVGLQVELEALWGAVARNISKRIEDARSIEGRSAALQHELLHLASDKEGPVRDAAAVFGLMQSDSGQSGATIATILDRLDTSPRTLRRRCHEHFGYGPKTLDRILRFQRFLALARSSPGASLAGMAWDIGYADQAHMSREVRELTGLSAKTFVSRLAA